MVVKRRFPIEESAYPNYFCRYVIYEYFLEWLVWYVGEIYLEFHEFFSENQFLKVDTIKKYWRCLGVKGLYIIGY